MIKMKDIKVTEDTWLRLFDLKLEKKAKNLDAVINQLLDKAKE
jgi:hypothetical protein